MKDQFLPMVFQFFRTVSLVLERNNKFKYIYFFITSSTNYCTILCGMKHNFILVLGPPDSPVGVQSASAFVCLCLKQSKHFLLNGCIFKYVWIHYIWWDFNICARREFGSHMSHILADNFTTLPAFVVLLNKIDGMGYW